MQVGGVKVDIRARAIRITLKNDDLRIGNLKELSQLRAVSRLKITSDTGLKNTFPGRVAGTRSARGSLSFFEAPWKDILMVMGVSGPTGAAADEAMTMTVKAD